MYMIDYNIIMTVSLVMTIVEAINIAVTVLFLILFSYRYYYLRGFSATDKYESMLRLSRILPKNENIVFSAICVT